MSELLLQVGEGSLSVAQAFALRRLIGKLGGPDQSHWHYNDCGCCVTLHGADCAYVIGRDGRDTYFAGQGCGCGR